MKLGLEYVFIVLVMGMCAVCLLVLIRALRLAWVGGRLLMTRWSRRARREP